jgi:hypothetical protein
VSATDENKPRQEPVADDGRMCALPTCVLISGITAGVGVALGPLALSAEGPWWSSGATCGGMHVRTDGEHGVAYTVLQPIVELLKNPVTTLLIVAVIDRRQRVPRLAGAQLHGRQLRIHR